MRARLGFIFIVWLYVVLAALYAVNTPHWQVPDEPAHYNYIRTIAEQAALPVLQAGDYDQAYLEEIKSKKFPLTLSIDSIRYESHQPPTYYLLAAPLYKLGEATPPDVRLISLRLASALWGTLLLAIVYRLSALIFRDDALLPLLACAFLAFVPQHLAMEGGVNNDALAEVVLAGIVLGLVKILETEDWRLKTERRWWLAVGLLVGLGLLTKTTTYISVGLVAATLLLLWRQTTISNLPISQSPVSNHQSPIPSLQSLILTITPALLLGSLWFARNALTYGATDWLGLQRHNAVVVGQPRTLDLYPDYAVAATYYFPTLFRSFWGQFGWMGVPLDARIYDALLVFTAFALLGLVIRLARGKVVAQQRTMLALLFVWFVLMLVSTTAYSLEFFQAQGRYLFPALGAIAIFVAVGLREWIELAVALVSRARVPSVWVEGLLCAAFVLGFIALDLVCLYRFIIPQLR